ncbi:hypothetical protein NDU88_000500 [Pleurodeles waltl]|uniref:Uncharacterized protein n=1 Tax=Pleurodeles waltl TaxID=8319 RepID=A0AAV7P2Q4_PLEWA|nr:hypothetical protein NDU88_000500 [Pleurodeles waltl]
MDECQISLRDKKLRKIKRDEIDYTEGRIYTFARKYDNLKTPVASKRTRIETSVTDTASLSSVGSFESTTYSAASTSAPPVRNPSPFLVEMERLRLGRKFVRKERVERPEGGG